jgi:hypothetical protein
MVPFMPQSKDTHYNVLDYLEKHHFVRHGQCDVLWKVRARHDTALVRTTSGDVWFVKHRGMPTLEGELSLEGEVAFHSFLSTGSTPRKLLSFIPSLIHSFDNYELLIYQGYPDHINLRLAILEDQIDTDVVPDSLGQALGMLHRIQDAASLSSFNCITSPVLTHGSCTPEILAHGPRAYQDLLRLLQHDPRLNKRLRELRASWNPTSLIHGDMKIDNVLVARSFEKTTDLLIVDWELVGIGDSRWDCASVIGSYLFTCIESLQLADSSVPWPHKHAKVRGAIKRFWRAYTMERAGDPTFNEEHENNEVFLWAGYWLLHRIMALLPMRRALTAVDLLTLHVASTLLLEG